MCRAEKEWERRCARRRNGREMDNPPLPPTSLGAPRCLPRAEATSGRPGPGEGRKGGGGWEGGRGALRYREREKKDGMDAGNQKGGGDRLGTTHKEEDWEECEEREGQEGHRNGGRKSR